MNRVSTTSTGTKVTSKVVFDRDIIITEPEYAAKYDSFGELLTDQQRRIRNLESNTKWLYKYGGMGSGGGGGGDDSASFKVTLTDISNPTPVIIQRNGTKLSYGGPGVKSFNVRIYKGGTSAFRVEWQWTTGSVSRKASTEVYPTDGFTKNFTVEFKNNTTFNVTITRLDTVDEEAPIEYSINVITTSYQFGAYYANAVTKEKYAVSNNSIRMKDVKDDGLQVAFDCQMNAELAQATYIYKDWVGQTHTKICEHCDSSDYYEDEIQSNRSKTIYLDLVPPDYDNGDGFAKGITGYLAKYDNAAPKYFTLTIKIRLKSGSTEENIAPIQLNDILIPPDLYLKVEQSDGILHDIKNSQVGYFQFNGTSWVRLVDATSPAVDVVAHASQTYSMAAPNGTLIVENGHYYRVEDFAWKETDPESSAIAAVEHGNNYYAVQAVEGTVIREFEDDYDGKFIAGSHIPFKVTAYNGSAETPPRTFPFFLYIDGWRVDPSKLDNITTLTEQKASSIAPLISNDGRKWHELKFRLQNGTHIYDKTYYIGVTQLQSFDWYTVAPAVTSYFRQGYGASGLMDVATGRYVQTDDAVDQTINTGDRTFKFVNNGADKITESDDFDQVFSIGIQYSSINVSTNPVFTLNTDNNQCCFRLYQNKIEKVDGGTVTQNGTIDFTLNKEDSSDRGDTTKFHLITIFTRLEKQLPGHTDNAYRSVMVFVDGVMDAAFSAFVKHYRFDSVTLHAGNYFVNLIECAAFAHTHVTDSEFGLLGPTQFFYSYDEKVLNHSYPEEKEAEYECKKNIFSAFKNAYEDQDHFICFDDRAYIETLANNADCPILMFNFNDRKEDHTSPGIPGTAFTVAGQDNLKLWMSQSYQQDDANSSILVPVTLHWADDKVVGLQPVNIGANPATFNIQLQGSSTLNYKCKNWELSLPEETDPDKIQQVYSPNFRKPDDGDTTKSYARTFLPERSFTLKADVVDSSHSNNNTMGTFINEVMTQFQGSAPATSPLKPYVKTCLTGFPVMLFLHTSWWTKDADDQFVPAESYYFLGIYNFNMGRHSYFNLGYSDLDVFTVDETQTDKVLLKNGFNIYDIKVSDYNLKRGLRIAEVQDNAEWYDFSQSGQSILFPLPDLVNDKKSMFGDLVDGSSAQSIKTDIERFVNGIAMAGGFIFDELKKNFSSSPDDMYGYLSAYTQYDPDTQQSIDRVPDYSHVLSSYNDNGTKVVVPVSTRARASFDHLTDAIEGRVEDEIEAIVNYNSVVEYYTICMAFGLVDSVQKNLNIKSWNDGKTFFVAFYDMDTCLGINNNGNKIEYFAFSDYWASAFKDGVLNSTAVQYDFSPKLIDGITTGSLYDIPSSYLFAIAKYAYSIYLGQSAQTTAVQKTPNYLWASWRNATPSRYDADQPGKGSLCNAKYFVNTYYKEHLNTIPTPAFNLNYCYKYLAYDYNTYTKTDGQRIAFNSLNFIPFLGRKLTYTEDWLNSRFHILDAYFNLPGIVDTFSGTKYSIPYPGEIVDATNSDIYVTHDIFSTGDGNRYTESIETVIRAQPYTPIVPVTTNSALGRYITPKTQEDITLAIKVNGAQTVKIGGSTLFTYIASVDPFITTAGQLNVNSNFLSEIKGNPNIDKGKTCGTWNITCPAVTNVELKCKNYGGELEFTAANKNLQTIDISNTSINLIANNIPLSSLTALNLQEASSIAVTNVTSMKNAQINGKCKSIDMPAWGTDDSCDITFPTQGEALTCPRMKIRNESFSGDAKITVKNNSSLTDLTVKNFTSVTVTNCPNLSSITFEDDTSVPRLKNLYVNFNNTIENTNGLVIKYSDYDQTSGVIDLSKFDNLETIALHRVKASRIKFSPKAHIKLNSNAFQQCTSLSKLEPGTDTDNHSIHTTFEIAGTAVFYQCGKFSLASIREAEDAYDSQYLSISPDLTSLASMFGNYDDGGSASLTNADAKFFLQRCYDTPGLKEKITTISGIFDRQSSLRYTASEMLEEYRAETCSWKLDFPNATNASSVFWGTNVKAFNKYMLSSFGTSASQINIGNIMNGSLSATVDFMYPFIDKITSFSPYYDSNQQATSLSPTTFNFIDEKKTKPTSLSCVNLADVFKVHDLQDSSAPMKAPVQITGLSGLAVVNNVNVNNFFDNQLSDLSVNWRDGYANGFTIDAFASGRAFNIVVDDTTNPFETLLRNIRLNSITRSFKDIKFKKYAGTSIDPDSGEETAVWEDVTSTTWVDLGKFINWDNIGSTTNLFYNAYHTSLNFNKKISYNLTEWDKTVPSDPKIVSYSFVDIWDRIAQTTNLVSIGYLFQNAHVVFGDRVEGDEDRFYPDPSSPRTGNPFYLNSKVFRHADDEHEANTTLETIFSVFDGLGLVDAIATDPKKMSYHYASLNSDFFKYFRGIKNAQSAFRGMLLLHTLPYDFFRTRNDVETRATVYIEQDDDTAHTKPLIEATLHEFGYEERLRNLTQCFESIQLKWNDGFDANAEYNKREVKQSDGTFVLMPFITDTYLTTGTGASEKVVERSSYWVAKDRLSQQIPFTHATEKSDLSITTNYSSGSSSVFEVKNFTLKDGSAYDNRVFVAPDILYGVNPTAVTLTKMFANSIDTEITIVHNSSPNHSYQSGTVNDMTFTGAIPQHMMKKCMQVEFSNMFLNLNILPTRVYSYDREGVHHECYSFVPVGFTNVTNLNKAFKFRIFMPPYDPSQKNIVDYYVMMTDSVSLKATSLNDALPSRGCITLYNNGQESSSDYNYLTNDHKLNYMLIGKIDDVDHKVVEGFNLSDTGFKSLKINGLMGEKLGRLVRGWIFDSTMLATSIENMADSTIISLGDEAYLHRGARLKLPRVEYFKNIINPNTSPNVERYLNVDTLDVSYDQIKTDETIYNSKGIYFKQNS